MRIIRNLALSGVLIVAGAVSLTAGSEQVYAATATAVIAVSATVLSFCTITALPLVFGNYSSAIVVQNTTVSILCTNTTPFTVGLSTGVGTGATVALREMTNGLSTLGYQLYSDPGLSVQWGPTVGTNTVAGVATGLLTNLTVYGRIPASEFATPGAYVDTVTATINY